MGGRRGHGAHAFTLTETLVAAGLLALVLVGGLTLAGAGARGFGGTATATVAEADITRAARVIETTLAHARDFRVASDGQSITYYNNDANYPPSRDSTPRRFFRSGTNLLWTEQTRPLLIDLTDENGGVSWAPFAPAGARAADGNFVTVHLQTRRAYQTGSGTKYAAQRALVRVAARNFQP